MEEVVTLKLETYDKLIDILSNVTEENKELKQELHTLKDKVEGFAIRYIKDNEKPALKEATVDELIKATDLNKYIFMGDLDYLKLLLDNDDIWNLLDDIVKEKANEADQ